jgi:hypothetical protein
MAELATTGTTNPFGITRFFRRQSGGGKIVRAIVELH